MKTGKFLFKRVQELEAECKALREAIDGAPHDPLVCTHAKGLNVRDVCDCFKSILSRSEGEK